MSLLNFSDHNPVTMTLIKPYPCQQTSVRSHIGRGIFRDHPLSLITFWVHLPQYQQPQLLFCRSRPCPWPIISHCSGWWASYSSTGPLAKHRSLSMGQGSLWNEVYLQDHNPNDRDHTWDISISLRLDLFDIYCSSSFIRVNHLINRWNSMKVFYIWYFLGNQFLFVLKLLVEFACATWTIHIGSCVSKHSVRKQSLLIGQPVNFKLLSLWYGLP